MANDCKFKLLATGFATEANKNEVKSIFTNGHKDLFMSVFKTQFENETPSSFVVTGICSWSVRNAMLNLDNTNYDDYKESGYTCLENLSDTFGCSFEVFGSEPCLVGQEHIIVMDGEIEFADFETYAEVPLHGSWNEFKSNTSKYFRLRIGVNSEEEWTAKKAVFSDYLPVGGFPSWDFTIKSTAA